MFVIFSLSFIEYIYINFKIADDNKMFISLISKNSSYANIYKINEKNIFSKIFKDVLKIDIKEPINMLKEKFIFKGKETEVINEVSNPLVYIYNTHQKEEYDGTYFKGYNITPGVLMASYILQNKLKEYGIESLVEETDIYNHMSIYGFTNPYSSSEKIVAGVLKKYPNLKLIIDLHRDSPEYKYTVADIDRTKYAKIMFVQGTNYKDYKENRKVVEKLESTIESKYPGLSKGILDKTDDFNQYLNNNMILIEIGGYQNNMEEVTNSINAFSYAIEEYLNAR